MNGSAYIFEKEMQIKFALELYTIFICLLYQNKIGITESFIPLPEQVLDMR